MSQSPDQFLRALVTEPLKAIDRAVALIWWHSLEDPAASVAVNQLADKIERAGYAKQNRSRLRHQLSRDPRTRKVGDGFGISLSARSSVENAFSSFVAVRPIPRSTSVLPIELFEGTRGYIERVVAQINASFDASLFDCTAVLCRRLLESLIIEMYERAKRSDELKRADGQFMSFSGLLTHLENDGTINLGRESTRGLKAFKKLGDQSAHNRRFNARQDDIIRIRDGLRIAAEELLHLAELT